MGIDGINISLDTLNPQTFEQITKQKGQELVLKNIIKSQELGIRTKVNTVLLKGINDKEFPDLLHLARDYAVDVRFIEIMPIGFGKNYLGYDREKLLSKITEFYPDYQVTTQKRRKWSCQLYTNPWFSRMYRFY